MTFSFGSLPEIPPVAQAIAAHYSALPQVVAVVLAGSQTTQAADDVSDYDIYVYATEAVLLEERRAIAKHFAQQVEINNQFWEPSDEWIDTNTGCGVDIMYRSPQWIEVQLERVLVDYQASVGYSTCFWWNVLTSVTLYDADGWFQKLQRKVNHPYPEPLKKAIIAKNYPILRGNIFSYTHQIESALRREDLVSINHRTAALLASYFDIIFAVNAVPHPGEKRLLKKTKQLCPKLPKDMEQHIHGLINSMSLGYQDILHHVDTLIEQLNELLIAEGLITSSGQLVE
jgi:hypothetical protein